MSADKQFIATADAGPESLIVVWDAVSGAPLRTYFDPAPQVQFFLSKGR